jgi:Acetyltransferase (GNAT) family
MGFRVFELTDATLTVDLLKLCFPDQNITNESFLWKHFDEFFEGQTVAFVAQESDLIIGFVCFTPFEILDNENVTKTWICAVQACHPDFRRRGIVKELTLQCEKIIGKQETYIGFSNALAVKIDQNSKSINYQIVGQMQETILLPSLFSQGYSIKIENHFNEKWQSYVNILNLRNIFQFSHFSQFTNWRYINNPKVKYFYLEIHTGNKLCVTAIIHKTNHFVEIDQITFCGSNKSKEILQSITNHFFQQEFKFTKIKYLPNQLWQGILPKIKIVRKMETYLTIKTQNLELKNFEKWIITGGNIL